MGIDVACNTASPCQERAGRLAISTAFWHTSRRKGRIRRSPTDDTLLVFDVEGIINRGLELEDDIYVNEGFYYRRQ